MLSFLKLTLLYINFKPKFLSLDCGPGYSDSAPTTACVFGNFSWKKQGKSGGTTNTLRNTYPRKITNGKSRERPAYAYWLLYVLQKFQGLQRGSFGFLSPSRPVQTPFSFVLSIM